jgi:hypothetical protein
MDMKKLESEIWQEIDGKNAIKNKIEAFETIYNTIQTENKRFAKTHNGSRIPELSRMAGPLFQTIGSLKRQIETPIKTHAVVIG